jgi:hypothetical protein
MTVSPLGRFYRVWLAMVVLGCAGAQAESTAVHDLAVLRVVAPPMITLTNRSPAAVVPAVVFLQNRGTVAETLPDAATLEKLLELQLRALDGSGTLTPRLVARKTWPVTLRPGQTLAVVFSARFDGSLGAAGAAWPRRFQFVYVATLHPEALLGTPDAHPENDQWPRAESGASLPMVTTVDVLRSRETSGGTRTVAGAVVEDQPMTRARAAAAAAQCDFKSLTPKPTVVGLKAGAALSDPITFTAAFTGDCFVSWGPGDAAKATGYGTPKLTCQWDKPGEHTVECYLYPKSGGFNGPHKESTIKVVKVTFQGLDGKKIGVTTGKDRSQTFHATVEPASESNNVKIQVTAGSSRLALKGEPKPTSGDVEFELEGIGTAGSTAANDCTVQALVSGKPVAEAKCTVIVPQRILSQDTSARQDYNYLAYEGTPTVKGSSPAFRAGPGQAHVVYPMGKLSTFHGFFVVVHVGDQFGDPCGDLYGGADVFEDVPEGTASINRTLLGNSTYGDPAGVPGKDWNPNRAPVDVRTQFAQSFLNKPALFAPAASLFPKDNGSSISIDAQFAVKVDRFPLQPPIKRTFTFFHDGTITLEQTP